VISLSTLLGCQAKTNEGEVTLTLSILGENETSMFKFKDATLLEVLENKYEVVIKDSLYTEYVECIKNICANDEFSWIYYVNDDPMNYGVSDYRGQDFDNILFVYKKV